MTAVANPRRRLAPRTFALKCVHSTQNSFLSTSHAIPERLDSSSRIQLLTARPHHRRRSQPQKAFAPSQNTIQYP